jgi:hypothetical protein
MKKTLSILSCIFCFTALGISDEQTQTQTQTKAWQEEQLAEIQKRIAGREDEPAEKVFQNIEILKGKKASRLPGMMSALTELLALVAITVIFPIIGKRKISPQSRLRASTLN